MRFSTDAGLPSKLKLLCFSHLRWNFVFQRPQQILTRAARSYEVQFMEEPRFGAGSKPHLESCVDESGVQVVTPVLPEDLPASLVTATQRSLLDRLIAEADTEKMVGWYYTPMALRFSRHVPFGTVVYDNMDELSAFKGAPPEVRILETELLRRSHVMFTGGHSLFEHKREMHPNIHEFPSSIDAPHFMRARSRGRDPKDQEHIPSPRVGYFGVIDERIDLKLLALVAQLRDDWQFVMLGPTAKIDPGVLPRRSNIHWLGLKSYQELPDYLGGWNVGMMPFALNEATRFISPTKTPEFLAAGIPVVSTPIPDVVSPYGELNLVEIARTPDAFASKIELLLKHSRKDWLGRVDVHLSQNSWDFTWERMNNLIKKSWAAEPGAIPAVAAE